MTSAVEELPRLLAHALPGGPATWHEDVLRWIVQAPLDERPVRLEALRSALREHPQRDVLIGQFRAAWNHPSLVRLLAETGLPQQASVGREVIHRLTQRIFPVLRESDNLPAMLGGLGLAEEDVDWIERLPRETYESALRALGPERSYVLLAARLVATRAAAHGLAGDVQQHVAVELDGSGFLELPKLVETVARTLGSSVPVPDWRAHLAHCRKELDQVHRALDARGVSTDLVFRLELLDALLARLSLLLALAETADSAAAQMLAAAITRGVAAQHSIRAVGRTAVQRLSRKIVEHTAETGEYYVARTGSEWRKHFRAAANGGFIVTATAMAKFGVLSLPLAPLWQGLALSLNYAVGFVAMQLLHFILASRQPSMTAAALASVFERGRSRAEEIELVAGISRSQVAAVLGNLLMIVPLSLGLDFALLSLFDRTLIGSPVAAKTLDAHHPLQSLVLPFAAATGLFLWLSSLAAGWAVNWSAYRRLPEAIRREPRLNAVLGVPRVRALSQGVQQHLGGIVGYLTLAFLLGFVPVFFTRFLGVTFDTPHVSLSAGFLSFSILPIWRVGALQWLDLVWVVSAIALVACINLGISFWLAFRTAERAGNLDAATRSAFARELRAAFRVDPTRFLWKAPR